MRANWLKLASLAKKSRHFGCFQFCKRVHFSQGLFLLQSTYTIADAGDVLHL